MILLNNPVLCREIICIFRKRSIALMYLAFIFFLGTVTYLFWPAAGVYSMGAQASRMLFTVFCLVQVVMIVLFAPAITATSITSEKETGTFDLLFATPISPTSIIAAKVLSAVSFLMILIVSSMPFSALCLTLGGISNTEILTVYSVLVMSALLCGLTGLFCSSVFKSSYSSLIITYVFLISLCLGTVIPSILLPSLQEAVRYFQIARSLSPFVAVLDITQPELWKFLGEDTVSLSSWSVFLPFSACMSIFFLILLQFTIRFVSRVAPAKETILISDIGTLIKRKLKFPFYLIDPMKRKRHIGFMNPVLIKEFRSKAFGRAVYLIRAMYVCFFISLTILGIACGSSGVASIAAIKVIATAFMLALIVLIAPSLTANAITSEKEQGNLDMLRMTKLSSLRIVSGKLQSSMFYILLLIISCAPMFAMLLYLESIDMTKLYALSAILISTSLIGILSGILFSSFMPSTAAAATGAYSLVALITLFSATAVFLGDKLSIPLRNLILVWNPFIASADLFCPSLLGNINIWQTHLKYSIGLIAAFFILSVIRVHVLKSRDR